MNGDIISGVMTRGDKIWRIKRDLNKRRWKLTFGEKTRGVKMATPKTEGDKIVGEKTTGDKMIGWLTRLKRKIKIFK